MLRCIYKLSGESVESVLEKKLKEGYEGKDLQKRKVLSLEWKSEGVTDDENGELMELMEEVSLKELGEPQLQRSRLGPCAHPSNPKFGSALPCIYPERREP